MPSLSEKKPLDALRILTIGRSGSGKTELAGTFYRSGGIAIASCDRDGVDVLLSKPFRQRYPDFDPANHHYEHFQEALDDYGVPKDATAIWEVQKYINSIAKQWPKYKTIVLDSLTMASYFAANAGSKAAGARNKSKSWFFKDTSHILLQTEADFGAEISVVNQLLDGLMRFPGHVIVNAHVREDRDKDTGNLKGIQPLVTGNVARARIAQWFREVWFLDIVDIDIKDWTDKTKISKQSVRVLQTQPSGLVKICKTLGVPNKMVNPNYQKIMNALAGVDPAA